MQHAEIYNGHARRFQQMARHIELSMTPQHQQKHGGPDPISTNDITLATTLINSVYGYPAGKQAVLAMSAGLAPRRRAVSDSPWTLQDDRRRVRSTTRLSATRSYRFPAGRSRQQTYSMQPLHTASNAPEHTPG